MRIPDEARFAVGTLTRVPVPPPARVNAGVAGRGLALAPVVGAGIGLLSGLPLLIAGSDAAPAPALLSAAMAVALGAWLTRGLHWDGLADMADGLGSTAPPERAREIMRRSDIGPVGVLTLVFTVLIQVASLGSLPSGLPALAAWVISLAFSRWALALSCGPWFVAARSDGLGALVVGAVTPARLVVASAMTAAVALAAAVVGPVPLPLTLCACPLAALAAAAGVGQVARRRLGGSTGDVLGASTVLATTAVLLTLALGQ